MSDLISRSEVLKIIDNIENINCKDSDIYYLRQKMLEMPSFDVDEVIMELEKEKTNQKGGNVVALVSRLNIGNAIEIIRKHYKATQNHSK